MCGRYIPLGLRKLLEVIDRLNVGASLDDLLVGDEEALGDTHPGDHGQLIIPMEDGLLAPAERTWGFEGWQGHGPIFNTRIETAIRDVAVGHGLWAQAASRGRSIVACAGFFEPSRDETVPSPRTGRPIKRQYLFRSPGSVTLLAAVASQEAYSIVTGPPNGTMAPIHDRMPLVLEGPSQVARWLGEGWRELADTSAMALRVEPDPAQVRDRRPETGAGQGRLF